MAIRNIGIVLFDGIERLDFEGPLAVFGWAGNVPIQLLTKNGNSVRDHLLKKCIHADGSTQNYEKLDLMIVPGGNPDLNGQAQKQF